VKCVICGKEGEYRICGECLAERKKVAFIENFNLEFCSKCNSVKIGKSWTKIDFSEAIQRMVSEKLRVEPNFDVHEIIIMEKAAVLRGVLNGDPVEVTVPLNYRVRRISCPRCSMESGGYYESIVQIRAVGRELREKELEIAKEIVRKTISESEGEKEFLSKFEIVKNGIDFYLGSRKLGEKISKRISEEFGGRVFETRRLHTRVDGRDRYRFTFLIKLPEYEDMDVVVKNETLYVVKNARLGKGIDIFTGKHANILETSVAVRRNSLSWGIITNLDESSAEVMTENGNVVIVQRPFGAEVGKEVFVFEYRNRTYAFPVDL